ncbi:MAG TPA: hypothetical protein VFF90_10555 [Saprospiraceae bacterium]|nr:hypothetical protein [Saprospiraceae bacterium]
MKSILSFSFILLLAASFMMTGCENDSCTRTQEYTAYQPVYKLLEEMRVPVKYESATSLTNAGKIFYYNGYLFVNELNTGIHIFDNTDPSNPKNVGFLNIPGNLDMAVHDHYLYADSYLDLVSIDIANPEAPVETGRVNDVFQSFYSFSDNVGYLVEYVPTHIKQTIDCSNSNWGSGIWFEGDVLMSADASFGGVMTSSNSSISPSVVASGSMARFTVDNHYLYTIDQAEIKVFDVEQALPVLKNDVAVQWGIETLFPMDGSLFIGSNNGMLIYDISNPEAPAYRSTFSHATACDPVVVSEQVAYVTLRGGNNCNGFTNQLDVLDVSNLDNPTLIRSYPMDNPHGLSVVGNTLYLCEGSSGLKIFDVSNKNKVDDNLLDQVTGITAYDVIVLPPGNHVMVVGQTGLFQFDATDRNNLVQLSMIQIGQ